MTWLATSGRPWVQMSNWQQRLTAQQVAYGAQDAALGLWQGLTLVHFAAHPEPFLIQNTS